MFNALNIIFRKSVVIMKIKHYLLSPQGFLSNPTLPLTSSAIIHNSIRFTRLCIHQLFAGKFPSWTQKHALGFKLLLKNILCVCFSLSLGHLSVLQTEYHVQKEKSSSAELLCCEGTDPVTFNNRKACCAPGEAV